MKKNILVFMLMFSSALVASELSLDLAKKVAVRAMEYGAKKGWKLSVAVVNGEGNLVYFERADGSYVGSIEAAQAKARSANAFQRPTANFVQSIKDGRLGLLSVKDIVAVEGGLPIKVSGQHLGAIGASGAKSTEDEEALVEGLKALEN